MDLFIMGFLGTLVFTPLFCLLAYKLDYLDYPGEHKQHTGTVPLVGGLAIVIGSFASLLLQSGIHAGQENLVALILASSLLLIIGIADDKRALGVVPRLVVQLFAALIMIYLGGVRIESLGVVLGYEILLPGYVAVPLTSIAVVGAINALNMVDGKDGLAGGVSLVTTLSLLLVVYYRGRITGFPILLALSGSLGAFLLHALRTPWRKKAAVFLGNSGSMALGLVLAWCMASLSQGDDQIIRPLIVLWFFAIPLFDLFSVIIRRAIQKCSPFSPDQLHLHHVLTGMGYSDTRSVAIILLMSAAMASAGIFLEIVDMPIIWPTILYLGLFLSYLGVYLSKTLRLKNRQCVNEALKA